MWTTPETNPFLLGNDIAYLHWRTHKLAHYPTTIQELMVPLQDPYQLTPQEKNQLISLCRKTNFAIYQINADVSVNKSVLHAFTKQLGLYRLDHNLCADEEGITALQVTDPGQRHDYIPYTNRPINWHTDGYYNTLEQQVQAVLLHCIRPALQGGENMLLDHEIAYLQLRDENPEYITALMESEVMTIPSNVEGGIQLRSAQTGPVFSISSGGSLHMRYTARTRNIQWKSHPTVLAALECLSRLFHSSPYVFQYKLSPHQGLICNNVLHNRSGFSDSPLPEQQRLLYRMRFYDRISGT